MHVLIAAHDVFPDPDSGGTGRYVTETASRLADRGHDVSVVTRRRGDADARDMIRGFDVYRYDLEIAGREAPGIVRQVPAALRRIDDCVDRIAARRPVDLVSFQGPVSSLLVDRAIDDGVPRVCTFHSPWPTEYRIRTREGSRFSEPRRRANVALRRAAERRVLERSDGAIALSEFMAGELDRVYGGAVEPTAIPGGVDVDRFSPATPPHEAIAGDPAFVTVRRLAVRMGHPLLLRAFARVVETHPDARLHVTGSGPLRADLEALADRLGIADSVTFLGYVPDEALPGVYAASDCFVLPTIELEGFGLATLEALASGTPVVATPVGATPEVLEAVDARLEAPADPVVAATTPESLAAGMRDWAALPDADREAAGAACRRYVERHRTWERTVAAVEAYWSACRTLAG